ncbi:MAG TPA: patatin-like phospholipase family protein [Saprospiraceae bacterium]|nr:patatin-like phospholipase family protein [Saprospiraceae bacterium]
MTAFRRIYYSFPFRLLALHFRSHLVLIGLWVFIVLLMTGKVGRFFGMHYLLLTPEYRGDVNFWSFFIVGAAFGIFVMIWNLTTYLLVSSRFPFLATLSAPFTKFSINNSLIPLAFFVTYLIASTRFQWYDELSQTLEIVWNIAGFLAGALFLISLLIVYLYFTNKDIGSFLRPGEFIPMPGGKLLAPGQRLPTLWEIREGATRWRVDTYLTERLHPRLVRSVAHYNPKMLAQVFRQNHFNAVLVQVVMMLLLMAQGVFMDSEWVRIPTGATVFILASMVMSMFGAITFWFRQWGTLVFIGLLLAVNYITGFGFFNYRNRAYGLDYSAEKRAEYSYPVLEKLCTPENMRRDKAATERILEKWLAKNRTPSNPKPKIVFLCVSGGGMRSALWTMQTLQQADRATGGKLLRQSMLITGASGGMLGAAYLREIYLRQQEGAAISVHDTAFVRNMGKDLLNPVTFAIASNDLFYPVSTFQSGDYTYRKDRGYLFEHQLNENCGAFFSKRIADYRRPERDAAIPMMVVSPYILNDARRLLISPQGVSYLMKPHDLGRLAAQVEIDGVDFGKLFARQHADSLAFSSALRMNCTFPFILPNAWLPTNPSIEAMDAGFRDNYGIMLATRFVHTFRDWIVENTGGVVIVQVRCWQKIEPIAKSDSKGVLHNLLNPVSAATHITSMQDFDQDNTLALLDDVLGKNKLEVIRFLYRPVVKENEASMSLHLSEREKRDLLRAFYATENQASLAALEQVLGK